jgi:hypothetical protein
MTQDYDDNKLLIWQNDILWHLTLKDFLANHLCRENQLNLKSSKTTN